MLSKITTAVMLSTSILLAENGASININETDLEIGVSIDSRNFEYIQRSSTMFQTDFNFLNSNNDKKRGKLLGAGFGATNQLEGAEGVELTFGAKLIWSNTKINNQDKDFTALPLMAKLRYNVPPLRFNIPPVALESHLLYAPRALAFADANNYREFKVSADIEMIENVRVYGGYRNIVVGYENDKDFTFNNSLFCGLKFIYQ